MIKDMNFKKLLKKTILLKTNVKHGGDASTECLVLIGFNWRESHEKSSSGSMQRLSDQFILADHPTGVSLPLETSSAIREPLKNRISTSSMRTDRL
jgi:hypothetical protein